MNHEDLAPADRPAHGEFALPSEFGLPSELEAQVVADAAPGPSEPPKVVIEYRSKGLPWPLVLPLLGLVSLAVVAAYHRLAIWSHTHPIVGSAPDSPADSAIYADARPEIEPVPPPVASEPLSLSSQRVAAPSGPVRPIGPTEFSRTPTDPDAVLMSLPFPEQLLSRIPSPHLAAPPPPTLWPAMILATPAPAPIPPRPTDDLAPVGPSAEPTSDQTPPQTAATSLSPTPPLDRVAPALPEPLPSREQVLADIRREAAEKHAERIGLKQFKDQIPELARQAAAEEVEDQRAKFVEELRTLIREKKGQAGAEIGRLHLRYNEKVDPKLEYDLRRLIKRFSGRASLRTKIKAFRALGLPEPRILEIAVTHVHRREHSGRCDRFEPEMYVLAARELIATELPTQIKPRTDRKTARN